jgi:hypothetical protein
MRPVIRLALLSAISVGGDNSLPTEIRLFKAGINKTSKGDFLFDAEAAASVMADYTARGVDIMFDLNHDSLDDDALATRADAGDARGWCKLELRAGELWAVGITWTPDGAERLTSKKQRYTSPAFSYSKDTRRIVSLENVAIVASPATFGAQQLVAADRRAGDRRVKLDASFDDIRTAISNELRECMPPTTCDCYVRDVYETYCVYECDGKLYQVAYTVDDGEATFTSAPVEVTISYTPVVAAPALTPAALTRVVRALAVASKSKGHKWTLS